MAARGKNRATVTVTAAIVAVMTLLQVGEVEGAFGIPEFLEFGECAPIKPMAGLNFERYSGIWFNIEMVPNEYAEITYCTMTNYTWQGDLMLVDERGLNDAKTKMKQASLMHPTEGQPGVLTVDAEGVPNAPYVVVETDYERYSCVHSCLAMMGFRAAFSWILSREPTLDPALVAHCHDRLHEWEIDTSAMVNVTQGKGCPYTSKLASVLDYSARVQAKATAKEVAVHKVKVDATAEGVQTVTDHRLQVQYDEEEEEVDEEEEQEKKYEVDEEEEEDDEEEEVMVNNSTHGRLNLWISQPTDNSSHGLLLNPRTQATQPMDSTLINSTHGQNNPSQLNPRTTQPTDNFTHGSLNPRTTQPRTVQYVDNSTPVNSVPEAYSQSLSLYRDRERFQPITASPLLRALLPEF